MSKIEIDSYDLYSLIYVLKMIRLGMETPDLYFNVLTQAYNQMWYGMQNWLVLIARRETQTNLEYIFWECYYHNGMQRHL